MVAVEKTCTGRDVSVFHDDIQSHRAQLQEMIGSSRIAFVGAAGSIGAAAVKTVLEFAPAGIALFDLSENNLVELLRDLRSTHDLRVPDDFVALPIGLGSVEFARYFRDTLPFDYLLNLAAIKHVRSEKDVYCLMRMLDTNVIFFDAFLRENPYPFRNVFCASSDKATNPSNLMGTSKKIMEDMLLTRAEAQPFSTARFPNVAFSDGSLPCGFLRRIEKRQPISAPHDVRRFFISRQEAGELCILSCVLGENCDRLFAKLAMAKDEKTFPEVAKDLLEALGYEPVECASEQQARARAEELIPQRKWPCYFFATDTTGEKVCEEFYIDGEHLDMDRFAKIGVIKREPLKDAEPMEAFIAFCRAAKTNPNITKEDYIRAMREVVPTLQHVETGRNLDQKM